MKNKKILIPVIIVGGILATLVTVGVIFSVMMFVVLRANGYTASVGRCIETGNDSYMIVIDNSPVVMSNQSISDDLFEDLDTGDKILVIHDGIDEKYPGGTGAYMIIELQDGSIKDIPEDVVKRLNEMGWIITS